jgi:GNAT superfamily N-acetyltransferase
MRDFIRFPWKVYRHDPAWVPPLISEAKFVLDHKKNPFWRHAEGKLFLVKKKRRVVGRIAAIIDQNHINYHHEKAGFFGYFECFKDYEAAELLLSAAKMFLRENGMEIMRGPMNPSTNEECGTLIGGFTTSPYTMMTHNPPYYPPFFDRFGLGKAVDWVAYIGQVGADLPKEMQIAAKYAADKHPEVKIRPLDFRNFDQEVKKLMEVYNSAWSKNWGFVPFTDEEIQSLAHRLLPIAVPDLALIAEIGDRPVGVLIGIPNFNEVLKHLNGRLFPFGFLKALYYARKITTARLIIMGVKEEYRRMGIEALLYAQAHQNAFRLKFKEFESSMILEHNQLTRKAAELFGQKVYKTFRIYEMRI